MGKILIFIIQTIFQTVKCPQDASFELLMALIGPTGRPAAMRMRPKKKERKK